MTAAETHTYLNCFHGLAVYPLWANGGGFREREKDLYCPLMMTHRSLGKIMLDQTEVHRIQNATSRSGQPSAAA